MGRRVEHLRENRAYTEDLWSADWLDGVARFHWRSWMRHPFANTRFRFWNSVPHSPRMKVEVMSIGSVDHEYRDADCIYLIESCARCGYSVDQGTFVPYEHIWKLGQRWHWSRHVTDG